MSQRIDGKRRAREITDELAAEVAALGGARPGLAFIRVGEDPASVSYIRGKNRAAEKIGIRPTLRELPESVSREELLSLIDAFNADPEIHGILVQSPLPAHLDEQEAFNRIHPDKDVDGFNVANAGRLVQEDPKGFVSCTPAGILELCRREGIALSGKRVAVLGRSLIVGKTFALLAMQKGVDATVTVCHSRTPRIADVLREADLVVAAIGRPRFVDASMVKPGACLIDVGINRVPDPAAKRGYRLVGDVAYEEVEPVAGRITPVPGGVGPMTVAMLMKNTLKAFRQQRQPQRA